MVAVDVMVTRAVPEHCLALMIAKYPVDMCPKLSE